MLPAPNKFPSEPCATKSYHPNYLCQLHQGELLAFGPGFVFPKETNTTWRSKQQKVCQHTSCKDEDLSKIQHQYMSIYIYNYIIIYLYIHLGIQTIINPKTDFLFPFPFRLHPPLNIFIWRSWNFWWVKVLKLRSPRSEPKFFSKAMLLYDMMYFTSQAISWSLGRLLAGFFSHQVGVNNKQQTHIWYPPEV